jgi:hypothetical protein
MNPDPEPLLQQLTPRGADAAVRARVLALVASELDAKSRLRWHYRCGLAVSASLLLGILFNVGVSWNYERRLALLYGPPPIPAPVVEIAQAVESVTDAPTAHWLEQRFALAHRPSSSLADHLQQMERILQDFESVRKEGSREKTQEDTRDRSAAPWSASGALAHQQWHCDLDHRLPA